MSIAHLKGAAKKKISDKEYEKIRERSFAEIEKRTK